MFGSDHSGKWERNAVLIDGFILPGTKQDTETFR